MNTQELWLIPLILLPGVALLILSTSTRFSRLHDEIHHQLDAEKRGQIMKDLLMRGRLFRNALVSLYLCVMFFSAAALLGGVQIALSADTRMWTLAALVIGITFLFAASIMLFRESVLSYGVIEGHLRD